MTAGTVRWVLRAASKGAHLEHTGSRGEGQSALLWSAAFSEAFYLSSGGGAECRHRPGESADWARVASGARSRARAGPWLFGRLREVSGLQVMHHDPFQTRSLLRWQPKHFWPLSGRFWKAEAEARPQERFCTCLDPGRFRALQGCFLRKVPSGEIPEQNHLPLKGRIPRDLG